MKELFPPRDLSAYEAITEAQRIAFAPFIFQAVRVMRELGILEQLEDSGESGATAKEIAEILNLSQYGVETLLESGLSCGAVTSPQDGRFVLTKVGYFLLHDPMTRINMDYNHYIGYLGMYYLDESIRQGRPAGLRFFGEQWETLYQALPHLPEPIKGSWYAFDHFYSDSAYPEALKIVLERSPATLLDIGANVGKFSLLATSRDPDLRVTMLDLPDQLTNAIRNVEEAGLERRIDALAHDLLAEDQPLPSGFDVYWLSQLLCCFGHDQIVSILRRIATAMNAKSRVFILETCWDRQRHEAAAYALINTSLYFTAIASGNSKMYHSRELIECIEAAGLVVDRIHDDIGLCHSLFECYKPTS